MARGSLWRLIHHHTCGASFYGDALSVMLEKQCERGRIGSDVVVQYVDGDGGIAFGEGEVIVRCESEENVDGDVGNGTSSDSRLVQC